MTGSEGMVPLQSIPPSESERLQRSVSLLYPQGVIVNTFRVARECLYPYRALVLDSGTLMSVRILPKDLFRARLNKTHGLADELLEQDEHSIIYTRQYYSAVGSADELNNITQSPEAADNFVKELGEALYALHALGFAHGNICPANIGIEQGALSLLDSGLYLFEKKQSVQLSAKSRDIDVHAFAKTMRLLCGNVLSEQTSKSLKLAEQGSADLRVVLSLISTKKRIILDEERDISSKGKLLKTTSEPTNGESKSNNKLLSEEQGLANNIPQEYEPSVSVEKQQSLHIAIVAIAGLMIFAAAISLLPGSNESYSSPDRQTSIRNLQRDWLTGTHAERLAIAERTLLPRERIARQAILDTCKSQPLELNDIDCGILSFSFDGPWSSELKEIDRQILFRLSLIRLLQTGSVDSLNIEQLHPATQLAILGFFPGYEPPLFAAEILTNDLQKLPNPIGSSFEIFTNRGVADCFDPVCFFITRLLVGDLARPIQVSVELIEQDLFRTVIWNLLDSLSDDQLQSLKSILVQQSLSLSRLNHGLQLIKVSDRRFLELATAPSLTALDLTLEELVFLSLASQSQIKREAEEALSGLFNETSAKKVIQALFNQTKLSMEQSFFFILALRQQGEERRALLARWFEGKPDAETVLHIILQLNDSEDLSILTLLGARYLKSINYDIPNEDLQLLLKHQDPLVRALAYSQLDPSNQADRDLLITMQSVEPLEKLRESLNQMLNIGQTDSDWEEFE